VPVLNDMRERHGDKAAFLCVYIREAHASDVWPIDGPQVKEPTTDAERAQVCAEFQRATGFAWPCAIDGVEDRFLKAFSPWPFRLYVLRGGQLALKSAPEEGTHSTDAVEAILRAA